MSPKKRPAKEAQVVKAFCRWRKNHPKCTAVFVRKRDVFALFGNTQPYTALSYDGVAVLPVDNDELPASVRFLAVFRAFRKQLEAGVRGQRIISISEMFTETIGREKS